MKKFYEAPQAELLKFTTEEATNDDTSVPGNVRKEDDPINSDTGWV